MNEQDQLAHLGKLLGLLGSNNVQSIDPSNFPNLNLQGLQNMVAPGATGAADVAMGGIPVAGLKGAVAGGGMDANMINQLYQLLTAQFRGMRGL